jgi:fucose permease
LSSSSTEITEVGSTCARYRSETYRSFAACLALFFVTGVMYASWGLHVPTVRDRFHLDSRMLSFALAALAGGSIGSMIFNGKWINLIGARRACLVSGLVMATCAALILKVPNYWMLLTVLAVFGAGMATLDVALNAEGSAAEVVLGRPLVSTLNGMFSVGGLMGSLVGGATLSRGLSAETHLLLVSSISVAVVLVACSMLSNCASPSAASSEQLDEAGTRWRSPALWSLGLVAFVALMAEGATYDWAAVYMRDVVLSSPAAASAAYAAFSCGMTVARFAGDAVRTRFGATQLLGASGALACVGITSALVFPHFVVVVAGFALMGFGLANVLPLLCAAAARVRGVSAAEGVSHVAGMAYCGLFCGPVVIGGVAQCTTLPLGLSTMVVCSLFIAVVGPRIARSLRV